ncbi:uncharacterized protein LOC122504444 [Leptopilina heterotoma]|uniref:uncharacterized protein LOC122504444 n=1 Tax=Leptopilina heterotoma TaxID=63436 RepID=UPI001CA89079|nr:uncharacterized protein LOC122504444 [Leptopilina heterotoma]
MDTGSDDDENTMLDLNKKSSLSIPTINDKNFANNADFKDNFLRLQSMVRQVYFSYLYKSLLSNYAISCTTNSIEDFDCRVKNCASQMELFAVRNALETSLYRKAMIKLISEVKEHTNEQKLYKSLMSFLTSTPEKSDVAVQTDQVVATYLKNEPMDISPANEDNIPITHGDSLLKHCDDQIVESTTKIESLSNDLDSNSQDYTKTKSEHQSSQVETCLDSRNECESIFNNDAECQRTTSKNGDVNSQSKLLNGNSTVNMTSKNILNESTISKADDSQDSLFQTMEDMFCESDDSSDLMTLIEKHSSSSNQLENSISQTTLEIDPENPKNSVDKKFKLQECKRKTSSNISCLKAKKRNVRSSPVGFNDLKSSKFRKKVNEIWLVERVHQSSKLKSKMLEISLLNYRKYGRIKDKFIALFGESDDEDSMPESPVCIEEHLQACKERIAPWIVKHLTPFYNQRRISSRELFKTICRHATDMLIINNTFPDEASVEHYMKDFFRNKKSINTEADIYL